MREDFQFMYFTQSVTAWRTWVDVWAYLAREDERGVRMGTVRARDALEAQDAIIARLTKDDKG